MLMVRDQLHGALQIVGTQPPASCKERPQVAQYGALHLCLLPPCCAALRLHTVLAPHETKPSDTQPAFTWEKDPLSKRIPNQDWL